MTRQLSSPLTLAVALAALLAASGPAQAQQGYVGAGAGLTSFRLDTSGSSSSDTRDAGYKLYGGAMFNSHFGIEASLFDLGKASATVPVPGLGATSASAKASGAALMGVAAYPLGDASVYAKAGIAYVRARTEVRYAGLSASASESSAQPIYGIGADYAFTPHWVGRFEWERVRVRYSADATDSADLVSVGLTYRF